MLMTNPALFVVALTYNEATLRWQKEKELFEAGKLSRDTYLLLTRGQLIVWRLTSQTLGVELPMVVDACWGHLKPSEMTEDHHMLGVVGFPILELKKPATA